MKLYFYLFTILAIICEISAQYLFKLNYLKSAKLLFVGLGVILYAFTGFFAYKLLKYESLGVANVIWHIIHFSALFFISIFVLKENLNNQQLIALMFGFVSIILFITADGGKHNH